MPDFLVEVYEGDKWNSLTIWNHSDYHTALDHLQTRCKEKQLEQDAHRLKPLRDMDAKINASIDIAARKKDFNGN